MMFLKLFTKIIWSIKGTLMTFLTHESLKMIYYIELKKKALRNIVKKIKSLQNQIEDLKKENEVLTEILTFVRNINININIKI